ncbi:hypothetical protein TPENAI_60310 [Tenacibaculum litopenaei]
MNLDPLAEKFYDYSPYNYSYNIPTLYTNPDGKNPVLGFILGALTEYVGIVGSKMLSGDSFSEANKSQGKGDFIDMAVAGSFGAASGFLDGGVTRFASKLADPKFRKALTYILNVGIDALESTLKTVLKNDDIDLKSILAGSMAEVGVGGAFKTNVFKEAGDIASANSKAASKKAKDLSKRKSKNNKKIMYNKKRASAHEKTARDFKILDKTGFVGRESLGKTAGNVAQDATKTNNNEQKKNDEKK